MSEAQAALDPEPEARSLRPRQAAFVHEYLVDLNASKAAMRAGYSPTTGPLLLQDADIKAAVDRAIEQRKARTEMQQDEVLHELSFLSHSTLDHYVIDDEGQVQPAPGAPEGVMRAIQSIKRKTRVRFDKEGNEIERIYDVEVRLWDKPGSLKLMGRHIGLFPDRVEHTGKGGGPIEVTEVRNVIVDPKNEEKS